MYYENPRPVYPNELYHFGVMGMHWGIRRYQPYTKGEKAKGGKKVKSGHFIGQAIAKNRTTRDSYLSSFLASDYHRKADKLGEETDRRKSKLDRAVEKGKSARKIAKRRRRYENAKAREADNRARANFWERQAKEDIRIANKVNKQFAKDHPHIIRKAPAKSVQSGANRWLREHTVADPKKGTASAAVAPIWNWDRGWGHQWAVEKTKGFDYKANRRKLKARRKAKK